MIDQLPRHVMIKTPLGPFKTDLEPNATVADLIEHVVSEKPLHRGDLFELVIDGVVVSPETGLDRLSSDDLEIIATGGAI